MQNIFTSKSQIVIAIIGIVGVVLIFAFLLSQQTLDQTVSDLTPNETTQADSAVKENLKESFSPDDLIIVNQRGTAEWAIALVYPKDENVDAGFVLLHKKNNVWKVVYGPATDYYAEDLRKMGAPQILIDQIDDVFIPPGH